VLGAGTITQWAYALPGELAAFDEGSNNGFPDLLPEALLKRLPRRSCADGWRPMRRWPISPGFAPGGPAEVLFTPADEEDLAAFCEHGPDIRFTVIGVGSNLLVRDGGVPVSSSAWRAALPTS
jgi:hypothetical protein